MIDFNKNFEFCTTVFKIFFLFWIKKKQQCLQVCMWLFCSFLFLMWKCVSLGDRMWCVAMSQVMFSMLQFDVGHISSVEESKKRD